MPYTDDPANSLTDQIRIIVGDTEIDCEELSDSVYEFLLDQNDSNVKKAALEALKAILAKYAKYANEKAGKLSIDYKSRFDAYQAMYDKLLKDMSFITLGEPFAGGIHTAETEANQQDLNKTNNKIFEGFSVPKKQDYFI